MEKPLVRKFVCYTASRKGTYSFLQSHKKSLAFVQFASN